MRTLALGMPARARLEHGASPDRFPNKAFGSIHYATQARQSELWDLEEPSSSSGSHVDVAREDACLAAASQRPMMSIPSGAAHGSATATALDSTGRALKLRAWHAASISSRVDPKFLGTERERRAAAGREDEMWMKVCCTIPPMVWGETGPDHVS